MRPLVASICLAVVVLWGPAAGATRAQVLPGDVSYARETSVAVADEPHWASMLATARQVLEAARASFEGVSGPVVGFYPGSPYYYPGQPIPFYFYVRDTATILPLAKYLYDDATLRTSLEEFLATQYGPDTVSQDRDHGLVPGAGAISATISPGRGVNKATVVSDEETSLVHAAYLYYRTVGGIRWLEKRVAGRGVLERLNAAMDWVLTHRVDPALGLVVRGHTTDWGDLKQEPSGEPTDVSPGDAWTYSIYDQALAFAALMELSEMNREVGNTVAAARYHAIAEQLRQHTSALLWMPERGYFRIHGHVSPELRHDFDEDSIVSIGNAAALYYGLASPAQAGGIMRALERARLEASSPKPGLSLHPPYPPGAFAAVSMAPRSYQNGAIWDWWGGRQVVGEFRYGNATLARDHLVLIAQDWAGHPGTVREWESPWLGRTGDDYRYAAAAAVVGEAIVEGLFGVSITSRAIVLEPRLGPRDGFIRAYVPALDTYAAYRHRYLRESGEIELKIGTNSRQPVQVRVLLPGPRASWSAKLGEHGIASRLEQRGLDTYLALEVPPGEHLLRLTPGAALAQPPPAPGADFPPEPLAAGEGPAASGSPGAEAPEPEASLEAEALVEDAEGQLDGGQPEEAAPPGGEP